jgi:hypothetical protein
MRHGIVAWQWYNVISIGMRIKVVALNFGYETKNKTQLERL